MACRGCAQTSGCACAVVGTSPITVTGTGETGDPYTVVFNGTTWVNSVTTATPDLCTEEVTVLARRADGTIARIPAQKRCAYIL